MTLYTAELRPLTTNPFKKVRVYSPKTDTYETYRMKRGEWAPVYLRTADQRFTFTPNKSHRKALTEVELDKLRKQYKKLGYAIRTKEIPPKERYPSLTGDLDADPDVMAAMQKVAQELDQHIYIASGGRTRTEQAILYDLYIRGLGNLAAKPGTSNHEKMRSLDAWVGNRGIWSVPRARTALRRQGFIQDVPSENWHCSLPKK